MNRTARTLFAKVALVAVVALAVPMVLGFGAASAQTRYLDDGAIQNVRGGLSLPAQGTCPAGAAQGYTGIDTRPECVALRLNIVQGSCTGNYSWSTGVCNDLINTTQSACEAAVDRMWNPATSTCSIVMFGDDRNNVVCALHQGTWVTTGACTGSWIMPARDAYTPALLTGNGAGDQCLRCHNDVTQYNGPRVRDTQETMMMGHRNMSRPVTIGMPWGGPPFSCSNPLYTTMATCVANGGTWDPEIYPSDDSGNLIDWTAGTITVGGNVRVLKWIYGDWLAALPRAIYAAPASTTQVCSDPRYTAANCVANGSYLVNNAGISYSCGRCHTTGWTSDATVPAANADTRVTKEPERSFPGINWPRLANAADGQVGTAGGVTGDPNRSSSWDVWGISCTRCHMSAIDVANPVVPAEVPPRYNAPTGMSTHHNAMTGADAGSGYCTDLRFTSLTGCNTVGAAAEFLTACSIPGVCSITTYTSSGTCVANGGTWTAYGDLAACTAGGGTFATSSCSVAGVCNTLNPAHTTQVLCEGAGGQWAAATDIVRCDDAGGRWTGTRAIRGQLITRLCMDCHRQETGGLPYDTTNPAGALKVGPAHGTVGFVSHPAGNQFLNSPHAKFNGTFAQIGTGKFSYSGTPYGSHFINDGEAAGTGNGCTGCHDVHSSIVAGEIPFAEECTECHQKDLNRVRHPQGRGTPIDMDPNGPEAFEACVTCHMPEGVHLFRINPSASYSTLPMPAALSSTVNANTSPAGTYTSAVWVDVDAACGQCHGGGTSQVVTTGGAVSAGSPTLTVLSTAGFAVGEKIEVPGAGGLYYDEQGVGLNRDNLETYIKAIPNATTITLAGNASATVSGKTVTQNAVRNGAGYMTKAQLAVLAKGIHDDKPTATFGYTLGSPNTLTINVNASGSVCPGTCNAYSWNWGDGTANGSGVLASHTYAAAGQYAITLTVTEYSVGSASVTRLVNVYAPDTTPTVAGTCTFNADTWTETVTDASTDTPPGFIRQVTVNWGDGGMLSSDTTVPFGPFTHTYLIPGNFTLTHRAYDNVGQMASRTCTANPAYFTVGGTIYRSNGTTPISTAMVQIRKTGTTTVLRTVYSNALGVFSIGSLKPASYQLLVTKPGYIFPSPAATVVVGPSNTTLVILATNPMQGGPLGSGLRK